MEQVHVSVVNKSHHSLPHYATPLSAGMDIRAFLNEPVKLAPGERALIPTGIFLELPGGWEAQVRPRSGLAFKYGITVLNAPGTIDADYRGEVGVILINLGNKHVEIQDGERIAQLVFAPCSKAVWVEVNQLTDTSRGTGGFGSTGKS